MIQFLPHSKDVLDIPQAEMNKIVDSISSKRESLGFIDVDTDIEPIKQFVQKNWESFDSVVVLGMGGSALGTKALLESLYGKYYNETQNKQGKNIYVLDNIDPETFLDVEQVIDISRTLFVFISKSAGTVETLSEYIYFRDRVKKVSKNWEKQFCFIVGENCSIREQLMKDFVVFDIPENIGGRFSVFTAVGLLPLAFSGIDIGLFVEALQKSRSNYLSHDLSENTALALAYAQYGSYNAGNNITVFFPYSSRLFQVGEWYKQLICESLGKDGQGITLISALGASDQHSQLQLYQDGPRDKLFLILDIKTHHSDVDVGVGGLSFGELLNMERYGTTKSLKNEAIPVCEMTIEKLDAASIAELLYMFMFETAYLGELFGINAFDQPGVEKSKIITQQKIQEQYPDINISLKAFND